MEHEFIISHALDLARRCREDYVATNTSFLDMSERAVLDSALRGCGVNYVFFGGYDDAERSVCVFLPEYIESEDEFFTGDECPIEILRCRCRAGSPELSHRDFLGSLMALGIKRENTGDILVYPSGADIIILKDIEKFLLNEYKSAGRVSFETAVVPVAEIRRPEQKKIEIRGSVASARLDNLISEAFALSRDAAAEAIIGGLVFVDNAKVTKIDARVAEGSKLVLRGKGKIVFCKIVGETRRGRLSVIFEKYV
ncbi:MAG: RNA-binding protein [Clostridia bacterium]|nr:RNA-binding protein [Clostridia bacterium]